MEVKQVFHMNGGYGRTSYANNSLLQKAVISWVKSIVDASIEKLCCTNLPAECLSISDLGCSSGANTLSVVSNIIDTIHITCQKSNLRPPSLLVFLNDLPQNDFNTVFRSLPDFYKKLTDGNGQSHVSLPECLVLSMVPEGLGNEGNICVAKTNPPSVFKKYFEQFKNDFTVFLRSRAEELVPQGRMVLTIRGSINSHDPLTSFEPLGLKINDMVSEGLIEKKKLDSFNIPLYQPTTKELTELIEAEGSFKLQELQILKHDWDSFIKEANSGLDKKARAAIFSDHIRSIVEPLLVSHFGDEIIEDLFRRYI